MVFIKIKYNYEKKSEIIYEILKQAGFDGYKFVIGLNNYEITECEKLLGKIDSKENGYI